MHDKVFRVLCSHRPVTYFDRKGIFCNDFLCEAVVQSMADFYRHQAAVIEGEISDSIFQGMAKNYAAVS